MSLGFERRSIVQKWRFVLLHPHKFKSLGHCPQFFKIRSTASSLQPFGLRCEITSLSCRGRSLQLHEYVSRAQQTMRRQQVAAI